VSNPRVPRQEELARLAAVVYPACAESEFHHDSRYPNRTARTVSREEESVRVASRLWLHAEEYCEALRVAILGPEQSGLRQRTFFVGSLAQEQNGLRRETMTERGSSLTICWTRKKRLSESVEHARGSRKTLTSSET
jgi:hypothetical protein